MRNWAKAAALAAAAAAMAASALSAQDYTTATITRTEHNIPHVVSDSWEGIGYGVAYAYAQDNFCMLAEELTTVAGERSLYFGPENSAVLGFQMVDNVSSDVFHRARIDLPKLREGLKDQSEEARKLLDGYVLGYNRFLADTGVENLPEACRSAAWVRPIDRDDLIRLNEKQMLLASSLALAPGISGAAPPGAPKIAMIGEARFPEKDELTFGSNGWAFGAEATTDGRGLLIGNPHFPWEGPARFWQVHTTLPGEFDVMGVGLAGTPMPTLGFNKDVAWTHTVTAARHFTLYALVLAPNDPTSYVVDGETIKMTAREISVPMPDGADPVLRTLYETRFGPIVTLPSAGVAWSEQMAFALRDANAGNQRAIDTWLRIGKAKNVGDIEAAVSETLGIPWVNTIAADRYGDALHADITVVPNVSADLVAACATPFSALVASRVTLLDGSRSDCDWPTSPDAPVAGLLPANEQASRTRKDYVTNSNDSYWISNPRAPYRQLSPILGDHEKALTLRTRSNFIETEAMLAEGKFDHARAKALAFANKSLAADMVVEPLLSLCEGNDELAAACNTLAGWDRRFEIESRGAYLFITFWDKVRNDRGLWQVPFDIADPVQTPRDLATEGAAGEKLLKALGEAATELEQAGIALDARWGDVLARPAYGERIALHGGPGTAGVLNMQRGRKVEGGMVPQHGTSYIQIVGFDEAGPVAEAILSYSQSTDPNSEFYADQTRNYSVKSWYRLPFSPVEIEEERKGQKISIAE